MSLQWLSVVGLRKNEAMAHEDKTNWRDALEEAL